MIEQPKVTNESHFGDDTTKTTHPAFAMIGANRTNNGGGNYLYGSDFSHQNSIRLTIARSYMRRNLSNDWHMGAEEIIEVELSEAQWASFVSGMNVGSGVPCTLRRHNGVQIPELPRPESRTDQFAVEMMKRVERAISEVEKLSADIAELKLSEKTKTQLQRRVESAKTQLVNNTDFVARQFEEHIERTVEKAKIEVNAYATATMMRLGVSNTPAIGYDAKE